jgi:hypothetical protein
MKTHLIFTYGMLFLGSASSLTAQEQSKKVMIVNSSNGNAEVEVYEGAEADSFLKHQDINIEEYIHKDGKTSSYTYSTTSRNGNTETIVEEENVKVIMVSSDDQDLSEVIAMAKDGNNSTHVKKFITSSSSSSSSSDGLSTRFSDGNFSYDLDVDERTTVDIRVTNSKGAVVHKEQTKGNDKISGEIDFSEFDKGSYTISFQSDEWTKTTTILQF